MTTLDDDPPPPIKQGCRLLAKDKDSTATVVAAPSFRVYYSVAPGAVPFMWESQPGTPKHHAAAAADSSLPPLTPPPSYLQSGTSSGLRKSFSSASKYGGLLSAILPRWLVLRRRRSPSKSLSMMSSSSSSSSSASSSSTFSPLRSLNAGKKEDDVDCGSSPKSNLCFRWAAPSPAGRL